MKWLLLICIHLYWKLIPEKKRRDCLFRESCSNYVYRVTNESGFFAGIKGLILRFRRCRGGYHLYTTMDGKAFEMLLADGTIITQDEIALSLISPYLDNSKKLEYSLNQNK